MNYPFPRSTERCFSGLVAVAFVLLASVAGAFEEESPRPGKERFIPANQLETIFERSPEGVMLPRAEFRSLLKKAQQAAANQADSPATILVRSAIYHVEQSDQHAIVKLSLDIEQFADQWSTLDIPIGNLLTEKATIGGNQAAIRKAVDVTEALTLVHRKPGRFTLKLELSTPLSSVGSDRVAAFHIVPNVASTIHVACPKDRNLHVNDLKLKRSQPIDQPTIYALPTNKDHQDSIRLKWTAEQQSTETPSMVFASTDAHLQLSGDDIRWNSATRVSVFGSAINQLSAIVPANLEVTAVDSTGLESWKLEDEPTREGFTRLLLNYRQPFTKDRLVKISAVTNWQPQTSSDIPTLELVDVTSHTGRLYISHEDQLRLMTKAGSGIRHLGTATSSAGGQPGELFDFWLQKFSLSVSIKPRDRELFAEVNSTLSIVDTTATFTANVAIETLNAPLFELPIQLPAGWQPQHVTYGTNAPLKWRNGSIEGQIVVEPDTLIATGQLFSFRILCTKSIPDPATEQLLPLPVLKPVNTLLVGGTYQISAAPDLTVAPRQITGLSPVRDNNGTLMYATQGTAYSGQLSVTRKPVRLASRSVLRSWMDTRQKTVEAMITVDVLNGTTRTLQLRLPEDLGESVRFSVVSIRNVPGVTGQYIPKAVAIVEQAAGDVTDSQRAYHLTFDKRFSGALTLKTKIQQLKTDDTKLSAPFVKVVGAVRQHGLLSFEAYPEQKLSPVMANISTSGLSVADASLVEPPPSTSGRRTALVYRYTQPNYAMELDEVRFATETVPSAVCEQIANISVLSENGTIQRSCCVQFRSVGVQTIRFTLPNAEESYLWSTVLNDKAVEVRRDGHEYLVAIPTDASNSQHSLEILFESAANDVTMLGETTQESLQLSIGTNEGTAAPINILEQTWDVRYPATAMLVNHTGSFHSEDRLQQPGTLQSLMSLLRLPSWNRIGQRLIPVAVIAAILAIATAMYLQRRRKSLFLLCVFGIFAVPTILLMNSAGSGTRPSASEKTITDGQVAELGIAVEDSDDSSFSNEQFGGGGFGGGGGLGAGQIGNSAVMADAIILEEEAELETIFDEKEELRNAPVQRRSGAARLSIRAHVASPAAYQSMTFRSIGNTQNTGTLNVVIQQQSRLNALRMIAASVIFLLFLFTKSAATTKKLSLAIVLIAATAVAVPLAPNHWQSAVDGLAVGTLMGIALWILIAAVRCRKRGGPLMDCCNVFRTSKPAAAASLILVIIAASTAASAAPPLNTNDVLRPDVILPYSPDRPELLAERVFLPKDEFLKLYQQAYPNQQDNDVAKTGVVAAFYKSGERRQIRDFEWTQKFQARFIVRSFSNTSATVRLPIGQIGIRSARLNGSPAVLTATTQKPDTTTEPTNQPPTKKAIRQKVRQTAPAFPVANTGYAVRIPSPGLHLLDVEFEIPATVDGDAGHIVLPLAPVPAGTISFTLPNTDLEVRVNGRSNAFRQDKAVVTIPIPTAQKTRIDWRPAAAQTTSDTIFHTSMNSALVINDAGLTLHSSLQLNCRQGQLPELDIAIPKDYAVKGVTGNEVAGWSTTETSEPTLKLLFKQPIEKHAEIQITLFRRQVIESTKTAIVVPTLSARGASRDSGQITVLAGREFEVRVDSLSGVSQLNAADSTLPGSVDKELHRVLAWRYTRQPIEISVRVARTAARMKITSSHGVELEPQRQLWNTLITANISGAPRKRLEIQVPSEFMALDVKANDLADWYYSETIENESTTKTLNIQFHTAKTGRASIVIQGQMGRGKSVNNAHLIAPFVVGADQRTIRIGVWLDAASEIASASADGWKRTNGHSTEEQSIRKLNTRHPEISFLTSAPVPGPVLLSLRQAPAALIAESVSVSNVTDTSIEMTLALNWQVSRAATREVSFTLPKTLSDAFDFKIPGLRQLTKEEAEDRVLLTAHLQQPVSDSLFIMGTATLPLPTNQQIEAHPPVFSVRSASTASLTSQSHFWVIVNQSGGLLEAANRNTDGNDVAPDQIRTEIPEGFLQQSVAIRRLKADRPNSPWKLKFPERKQTSPAVITLAAHTTIIAKDSTWRSRHVLQVRNDSRQFLPIILPNNSRFLYCLIKGQPTRIVSRKEGDQTLHLIPVPQTGEISAPFDVTFALTGTLAAFDKNLSGQAVNIPAPTIPEYREFPTYGVTVTRNTWSVYVPDDWQATILDDPRQTNVIEANEDDFEDASLLSVIDTLSLLSGGLSSSLDESSYYSGYSGGSDITYQLEAQKRTLEGTRGNSIAAESQRTEALNKVSKLLNGRRSSSDSIRSLPQDNANGYLDIQEATQNRFNIDNNSDLFLRNGISSEQLYSRNSNSKKLGRFALPVQQEQKAGAMPSSSELQIQSQNGVPILNAIPEPKSELSRRDGEAGLFEKRGRSQLMQRRNDNIRGQLKMEGNELPQPMEKDAAAKPSRTPSFGSRQLEFPGLIAKENADEDTDGLPIAVALEPQAESTQGLLSLHFEIPEDGVRHDFVRTGGNATLTVTIKDQQSIRNSIRILWTAACLLAAILLLKRVDSSPSLFVKRALLMTAIAGICGWLFLPAVIRILALLLCIAASIGLCLIVVQQNKSVASPE